MQVEVEVRSGQECRVDTARAPVKIMGPTFFIPARPARQAHQEAQTGPLRCALWGLPPSDVFSARQRDQSRFCETQPHDSEEGHWAVFSGPDIPPLRSLFLLPFCFGLSHHRRWAAPSVSHHTRPDTDYRHTHAATAGRRSSITFHHGEWWAKW